MFTAMPKRKSIRFRITLSYLLIAAAAMIFSGIFVMHKLENYQLAAKQENLELAGKLLAPMLASRLTANTGAQQFNSIAADFARQVNARVIILDGNGTVIGDSGNGEMLGQALSLPEVTEALQGRTGSNIQPGSLFRRQVLQVAVPLAAGQEGEQKAAFFAASLAPMYENLAAVRSYFIVATLAAMALAAGIGAVFSHRLSRPVREITAAARCMADGKLENKIPVISGDEIGELANQLNNIADSLKEIKKRTNRFVADVSHELRTPLASILLCLQSLQHYDMKVEQQHEFLQDINQETQRMIYLVEELLELTRREEVADRREIIPLNIPIAEVLNVTIPRAERKELQFFSDVPENLPSYNLSPNAFKRVLFNILDNAIKFTPAGGWVKFKAEQDDKEIRITVQDTGCGIPRGELPFIFERFYRVDQARSRDLGGAGLGLAISKEIVEHYGGTIVVDSREEEGSTFSFTLPLASA